MICSIAVVGVLTWCALLHSKCDLKATKMNMHCSIIWELILYQFELGHNIVEATKKICCAKSEGADDQSTATRWFKKLQSGCKNLDDQVRLGWFKTMDFKTVLQAIVLNPVSSTQRVSGNLYISQGDSSPSQTQLKYLELPNFVSCYKNMVKVLIHLAIALMSWVFANGPGVTFHCHYSQVHSHPKR